MLDTSNPLVKTFKTAKDRMHANMIDNLKIRLIHKCSIDGRRYNLPMCFEVAALIVGDIGSTQHE